MADIKRLFKSIVADGLNSVIEEIAPDVEKVQADSIQVVTPPNQEMGDIGSPLFAYAKILHTSPQKISEMVCEKIGVNSLGEFIVAGPYINVRLENRAHLLPF